MVVETLSKAGDKLSDFKPKKKWYRRFCKRSAVAVILKNSGTGLQTLMIKRAQRDGDPWSGQMAFPGGRFDNSDCSILDTARRETWEEIGLETQAHTQYLGRLSDLLARPHRGRKPMVVTPYLFTIECVPDLNTNHEVDEVIWVPLAYLADPGNRQSLAWKMKKMTINMPCYYYQGRPIWGLSLMMLEELIALVRN